MIQMSLPVSDAIITATCRPSGENAGYSYPARASISGRDAAVTIDAQQRAIRHRRARRHIHERSRSGRDGKIGSSEPRRLDTFEERDRRLVQIAARRIEWRGHQPAGLRVDQMPGRKILGPFADDSPVAQHPPLAAVESQQREVPRVLAPDAEEHLCSAREQLRVSVLRLVRPGCRELNRLTAVRGHQPQPGGRQRRREHDAVVLAPRRAPYRRRFANGQRHTAGDGDFLQQAVSVEGEPAAIGREERGARPLCRRNGARGELIERPQEKIRPSAIDCRGVDQELAIRRQRHGWESPFFERLRRRQA